jgi:transcriptional regulator with XRE-family HTH domain
MYQRIRDLREDADKTQQEVAEAIGMWLNTYRNYETGKREPPFDVMIALARYYNVSLDYLAGLTYIAEKLDRFSKK